MLELKEINLFVEQEEELVPLLVDISTRLPVNHFCAVIGPSGCGKSTLLKTIAGIAPGEEEGAIFWCGRNLEEEDFLPSEIGYVPQFGIAHPELTALESVEYALRLRVGGLAAAEREERAMRLLAEVGIEEFADRRVSVLSGGQQRRLALAMEITSRPHILLCDEVTSGLDPQSEDEIVRLLNRLAKKGGRLILSVTHSLAHLELYDSVMVLFGGRLVYHGPPSFIAHYFNINDPSQLYEQLENRTPEQWAKSWHKHHRPFDELILGGNIADGQSIRDSLELPSFSSIEQQEKNMEEIQQWEAERSDLDVVPPAVAPGGITQFFVLLQRRLLIFSRSKAQIIMQAGLIFGFPLLVAVFAWNGLPNVKNLTMGLDQDVIRQLAEAGEFLKQSSKVGSLVSGIVMFQVILLTLMGANNSGREVASERLIFEKEKLSGLRAGSYLASKAAFLGILVLVQSVWMGVFVHFVCGLPGDLLTQLQLLILVNAAMTSVCLALSSWLGNAEQASLASVYLVGFQLPLSGAVLALPSPLDIITRPFISAYWSWSGILQTLRSERYYDIVQMVAQTTLSPLGLCIAVLVLHVLAGLIVAWLGCQRQTFQ